jgi:hypothetical protein
MKLFWQVAPTILPICILFLIESDIQKSDIQKSDIQKQIFRTDIFNSRIKWCHLIDFTSE